MMEINNFFIFFPPRKTSARKMPIYFLRENNFSTCFLNRSFVLSSIIG